jgi:hypothetical protein
MHLPINVKSPNNISKWHMGFNSAFKGVKGIWGEESGDWIDLAQDGDKWWSAVKAWMNLRVL